MSAIVTVETSPSIAKALITSEALEELGLWQSSLGASQ
jgi:hypothetical protein